jgi:hypothetical protein
VVLELLLIRIPDDNPAGLKAAPHECFVAVIAIRDDKITLPVAND